MGNQLIKGASSKRDMQTVRGLMLMIEKETAPVMAKIETGEDSFTNLILMSENTQISNRSCISESMLFTHRVNDKHYNSRTRVFYSAGFGLRRPDSAPGVGPTSDRLS